MSSDCCTKNKKHQEEHEQLVPVAQEQGKVVTQFEELGWWSILMVDCVTLFLTK